MVEIVLAIQALRHGQYALVEMSLIGSILSNLLLVLGCCYIAGGYFHHVQEFNIDVNMAQVGGGMGLPPAVGNYNCNVSHSRPGYNSWRCCPLSALPCALPGSWSPALRHGILALHWPAPGVDW